MKKALTEIRLTCNQQDNTDYHMVEFHECLPRNQRLRVRLLPAWILFEPSFHLRKTLYTTPKCSIGPTHSRLLKTRFK